MDFQFTSTGIDVRRPHEWFAGIRRQAYANEAILIGREERFRAAAGKWNRTAQEINNRRSVVDR